MLEKLRTIGLVAPHEHVNCVYQLLEMGYHYCPITTHLLMDAAGITGYVPDPVFDSLWAVLLNPGTNLVFALRVAGGFLGQLLETVKQYGLAEPFVERACKTAFAKGGFRAIDHLVAELAGGRLIVFPNLQAALDQIGLWKAKRLRLGL